MDAVRVVLLALAVALTAAALLPLVRAEAWWIRVFDFPRLQILFLGAVVFVALAAWTGVEGPVGVAVLIGLAGGLILEAIQIAPYTRFGAREVEPAKEEAEDAARISLLIANVLMSNRQADRLIEIVRSASPDLVLTLEPDSRWERALRPLERDYPHTVKVPLENRYGILLHSRLALRDPRVRYLVQRDVPSIHVWVRLRNGTEIFLHCIHPEPPGPTEAESSAERDAELLIVGKEARERGGPTIVAGDLNDVAWSHTTRLFQKVSGLLDPRRGRGMFNSFHARNIFLRFPLDHVFHSPHFLLEEMRRLPAFGSDHFPIYVRLSFQPGEQAAPEELREEEGARREADEKTEWVKRNAGTGVTPV